MVTEGADTVEAKLDILIRLTALALIENRRQRDQIRLLSLAGIKPAHIAKMIRTSRNNVNVVLSTMRRDGELRVGGRASDDEK